MNRIKIFHAVLITLWLSGCSVHTLDIQQGNVITPEQAQKLSSGMTRSQVRFLLGTPIIQDPFHADRWDYLYTMEPGDVHRVTDRRRITVFFEQDKVSRVESEFWQDPLNPPPR